MRNEEFEIVRDLVAGREPRDPQEPEPSIGIRTIAPASFREIEGQELIRQYVANRRFRESEARAQRQDGAEIIPDRVQLGTLAPGQRLHPSRDDRQQPPGWLRALARFLWRR